VYIDCTLVEVKNLHGLWEDGILYQHVVTSGMSCIRFTCPLNYPLYLPLLHANSRSPVTFVDNSLSLMYSVVLAAVSLCIHGSYALRRVFHGGPSTG
jgi:hypothetical protein